MFFCTKITDVTEVTIPNRVTSLTFTKLKSKKTYYVRMRDYNMSGSKKIYGKWSMVKKCKVKVKNSNNVFR